MTPIFKMILVVTGCLLSLIAGLFYSYSCSVNLGLGKLSDPEYLRAMQSINRAILNPWFFTSFIGVLILLPLCTWMARANEFNTLFYWLLTASLIYALGTFGVTIFGNVPLNEALDRFDITNTTSQEIRNMRIMFEGPWNKLNLIRTIANIASLLALLAGLVKNIEGSATQLK